MISNLACWSFTRRYQRSPRLSRLINHLVLTEETADSQSEPNVFVHEREFCIQMR